MREQKRWEGPDYAVLFGVVTLHMALLAALLLAPRTPRSALPVQAIELLLLPPRHVTQLELRTLPPRLARLNESSLTMPPLPDAASASQPASGISGQRGSDVDWRAEARRAVQAYEIRSHQPLSSNLSSTDPAADAWWPQAHHAGEQFKTPAGDWIVWINADCYEIATSVSSAGAPGVPLARTICGDSNAGPPPRSSE